MSDSRDIQILDAAIAALNLNRPTDVPEAGEQDASPESPMTGPVIGVFLGTDPASYPRDNPNSAVVERALDLWVQMGDVGETRSQAERFIRNTLRPWVVSVLGRTTFDGLALAVLDRGVPRERLPVVWKADRVYVLLQHLFVVRYQTKRDDMTAEA